jgi:hypothetical protein
MISARGPAYNCGILAAIKGVALVPATLLAQVGAEVDVA